LVQWRAEEPLLSPEIEPWFSRPTDTIRTLRIDVILLTAAPSRLSGKSLKLAKKGRPSNSKSFTCCY